MSQHISIGIILVLALTGSVLAEPFGKAADGTPVESYTLKNKNGMTVKVMTLGATITEIDVPDKNGKFANVVLGFDSADDYESNRNQSFGATVGRVCNRTAKGKFTLGGKEYQLTLNNGPNHLHGGVKRNLSKVVWKKTNVQNPTGWDCVGFAYTSPDGEEGYPGTVSFTVIYMLTEKNELLIDWLAKTDKATPVNLTNHSYFNLAGAGSPTVLDHELMVVADRYLPTDNTQIPTGKLEPVKGTVFDFNKMTRIGDRIDKLYGTPARGYDHFYIRTPPPPAPLDATKMLLPPLMAKLRDPSSGRVLTVLTTQPGVQIYTGNNLSGQKGKGGKEYKQRSAVCLETSHYPDSLNQPTFPSIILRPGQQYSQKCIYAFSAE